MSGQISLPARELEDMDVRKGFIVTSRRLNNLESSIPSLSGAYQFTGSATQWSLPTATQYKNQILTVVNTGSGAVRIKGTINGYSSWTLDSAPNWWSFLSDGAKWYCIGGLSDGSNSNGSWVKWADGTMIQRLNNTATLSYVANGGYYFYSSTWTFPTPFVDSNYSLSVSAVVEANGIKSTGGSSGYTTGGSSASKVYWEVWKSDSQASVVTHYDLIAIGKWK